MQWFNAGGMVDFYDWDLDSYINVGYHLITFLTITNGNRPQKRSFLVKRFLLRPCGRILRKFSG